MDEVSAGLSEEQRAKIAYEREMVRQQLCRMARVDATEEALDVIMRKLYRRERRQKQDEHDK